MKRPNLRAAAMLLAVILLTGCAGKVVEATKPLEPLPEEESSSAVVYPVEFPSAQEELPTDPPAPPLGEVGEAPEEPSPQTPDDTPSSAPQESQPSASQESSSSVAQDTVSHPFELTDPDGSFVVVPQQPGEETSSSQSGSSQDAAADSEAQQILSQRAPASTASVPDEVRAVWISYLDFYTLAQNKSRSQFTSNIDQAFSQIADYGLNTVFVQVRPFGDAMYPSDYFPWSYVLTGTEGENPGYDPLGIMVEKAKEYGLRIEAWINPYRVRAIGSSRALSADNPAVRAVSAGKDTAISWQGGLFYNPASQEARDLITAGVVELVEGYDLDGIHFDDYFYPTTDLSFDAASYRAYQQSGGALSQADWRRRNVDLLVRQVYTAIKQTDSSVLFGISPQARMDNNYDGQFIDVENWLENDGYLDYICPQIYFGFDNQTVPYADSLDEWDRLTRNSGVQLYVGLAAYKCGVADQWAGAGANEWVEENDLLERMVAAARDTSEYGGFALYRYDSLFNPESGVSKAIEREMEHLSALF